MKNRFLKIFYLIIILFLLGGIFYGSFFLYQMYRLEHKITFTNSDHSIFDTFKSLTTENKNINLKSDANGRINILLLGMAGKGKPGQYLTDSMMIARLDTKTNRVALISIPRDLYVKINNSGIQTKINAAYQYGLSNSTDQVESIKPLESTLSEITGLTINYYVVLNFDGFKEIVDSVGGVNIMNERDIHDPRYPGPNYSYETFDLEKGFHQLDGATALKYARERHNDPDGDFGRAKRQQQILQATKNKIFSASTMLNAIAINDLFSALGENIRTDINPREFEDFIELSKKLDTNNITNVVVDAWSKDSLLKVSHVTLGNASAFVLIPRVGNWSEIQDLAQNVFDLTELQRKREAIIKESASVIVVNKSESANLNEKIKKLLTENLGYKNVAIVSDPIKNTEEKTVAYDLTNGIKPFTLNEIVRDLPAQASYTLPDKYRKDTENTTPDIVVVLGKDLITRYNMDEASLEDYKNSDDANNYSDFIKN